MTAVIASSPYPIGALVRLRGERRAARVVGVSWPGLPLAYALRFWDGSTATVAAAGVERIEEPPA